MFKTLEELNQDFTLNFLAEHPELETFDTDNDAFEDFSFTPNFRSQLNSGVTSDSRTVEDSTFPEIPQPTTDREPPTSLYSDIAIFDMDFNDLHTETNAEPDAFSEILIQLADESKENKKGIGYQFRIKRSKRVTVITNVLFYAAIVGLLICAIIYSFGEPKPFLGYYLFNVETSSMQSVYPVGSLVITKEIDPNLLEVADDISFKRSDGKTITHRIISIVEDYENTQSRAFEVKGVENPFPDQNKIRAGNVLGKVVGSVKVIGGIAAFISKNLVIIIVGYVIIVILAFGLRWYFSMSKDERKKRLQFKNIKVDLYDEQDEDDEQGGEYEDEQFEA